MCNGKCNAVVATLLTNAVLHPRYASEDPLNTYTHHKYRSIIGGISYFANSIKPGIIVFVGALARNFNDPSNLHLALTNRFLDIYLKNFAL